MAARVQLGQIFGVQSRRASRMRRSQDDDLDIGFVETSNKRLAGVGEDFDRMAFAKRVLRVLEPRGLRVVVYPGRFSIRIEQGRMFRNVREERDVRWATVAIAEDASREHIALALAELAGVARVPFLLDLLVRA